MDNYLLIDRSEVAKDWHTRGFSCGLWIDHAGREWSYDAQETEELFMIMSGELELEIEGRSQKPSIGQEISIPAGVPYIIRNIGPHLTTLSDLTQTDKGEAQTKYQTTP